MDDMKYIEANNEIPRSVLHPEEPYPGISISLIMSNGTEWQILESFMYLFELDGEKFYLASTTIVAEIKE